MLPFKITYLSIPCQYLISLVLSLNYNALILHDLSEVESHEEVTVESDPLADLSHSEPQSPTPDLHQYSYDSH